jgi:hypothetical protein
MVYHLPMMKSDRAPILLVLDSNRANVRRPFRFENWWLLEDDFTQVAKNSWLKFASRPFHQKTHYLASDLKIWRKNKPKLSDQLSAIENQLLFHQSRPPDQQNHSIQKELIHQHHEILAKNDAYHRQRYKKNWPTAGDRNTSFFHHSIIKRARRNIITHLQRPDGSYATTQQQLAQTAMDYFRELFSSQIVNSQLDEGSMENTAAQVITNDPFTN